MSQLAKKLKGLLEKAGKLDPEAGEALLNEALQAGRPFSEMLVKKSVISESELLCLLAKAANIPPVDLSRLKINQEVLDVVPQDVASSYKIFPIDRIGGILTLAIANPFDVLKLDDIRIITGSQLRPVVCLEEAIEAKIPIAYKGDSDAVAEIVDGFDSQDVELKEGMEVPDDMDLNALSDEQAPVVKLVNKIVHDACTSNVSDVHFEPFEKKMIVRYRRDGDMTEAMTVPKKLQNAVTSRIKIMAKLDIAEKQKPQDGKFQMKMGNKTIDFRVSILPVIWGEKTVFRILDSTNLALDMNALGFEPKSMEDYVWACGRPYGMLLVTGPTGSGKSTTLYSAVRNISKPDINLVTVEDPVEYTMEGINQVPVNPKRGMTFAGALRSILRQDPDVVLLGEIRDQETLEIAIKAALTGHLVLSTLHTNDAPSTITRMIDMGVDPFMVASATTLIAAQRLARKLCSHCKQPLSVSKDALLKEGYLPEDLKMEGFQLFKAVGCPRCNNGYKGRFALLETMRMSEPIRRLVVERANQADVKKQALSEGMLTLRRCGLLNAARGKTTLEEVCASTMAD